MMKGKVVFQRELAQNTRPGKINRWLKGHKILLEVSQFQRHCFTAYSDVPAKFSFSLGEEKNDI
jgi:hypothetical protein